MNALLAVLTLFTPDARAQACACSQIVALPTGTPLRAWAGVAAVEYGASLSGDTEGWRGVAVTDLYGDSMAGMYMPPHLVHTASLSATLGLPASFSVSATLPYQATVHLGVSEMPGDVDSAAFADAGVTARWGHVDKARRAFFGFSAGLTFPTGKVIPDSPVRSGRGVFGASLGANGGLKVSPKVTLAAQISGSDGFGADPTGYTVAPTASLVAGATWWPRENGKLNFAFFATERWSGNDRQDAFVYKNTGYWVTELAVAVSYTFWAQELRSAGFTLRGQAPVFQVVGDPMYAANVGGSLGVSVVAF